MMKPGLALLIGLLFQALCSAACPIQRGAASGSSVWLLCESNELLVSIDGGSTWQTRKLPQEEKFRAVWLLDQRRGFVAGNGGLLLATDDGAESWKRVALPTQENLTSMYFVGDSGWLAGWTGLILHTKDAGKTWVRQQSGVLHGLESVYFADVQHGWIVGWAGSILRTTDGGATWQQVKTEKSLWSLDGVYFADALRGWAVGFGGQILATNDGGVTWKEQPRPVQGWLRSLACNSAGRCWIASDRHLLVSEDRGETWKAVPDEGMPFLHQVLPVKDSLWALGQFGVLRQSKGEPAFTALATLPGEKRPQAP